MRWAWGIGLAMVAIACGSSETSGGGNDGGTGNEGGGGGTDTCTPAGGHCACGCNPGEMVDPRGASACPQGPPNSGICGLQCCVPVDAGASDAGCTGTMPQCFCGSVVCENGQWTCTSCGADASHD